MSIVRPMASGIVVPMVSGIVVSSGEDSFDFYVDSVNGSDSNSGKNGTKPFLTIAAAVTAVGSSANKKIGLARGSSWKETLHVGTSASPINGTVVGAYGSGADPLLDCSDALSAGGWTKEGTATNVYRRTITLDTDGTHPGGWVNVWENGSFLVNTASIAACDALAGSYFVTDASLSSTTLYINASGAGKDPSTNGNTYEYSKRLWGAALEGDNCVISGVRTRRNHANDGSLAIYGKNGRLFRCTAEEGFKHNGIAGQGVIVDTCTFTNAYWGSSTGNLFVCFEQTATGLPISVMNSTFTLQSSPTAVITGVYCHTGTGSHSGMSVTNCRFNGPLSNCVAGVSVTSMSASDCVGNGPGTFGAPSVSTTYTRCQLVSSASATTFVNVQASSLTLSLTGCKACLANVQNGMIRADSVTGSVITATSCQFYMNTPNAGFPRAYVYVKDGTVTLSGNTFDFAAGANPCLNVGFSTGTVTLTSDNNVWTQTAGTWTVNGTSYGSFALFQAAGFDTHSTTSGNASSACTLP